MTLQTCISQSACPPRGPSAGVGLVSHHGPGLGAGKLPVLILLALGCGDEGVSFEREVRPVLDRRCVVCHHSDNKGGLVDIEDPFTLDEPPSPPGLVGSKNVWAEGHPGFSPEYNVVPFEPDASFLIQKITGRDISPPDNGYAMPPPAKQLKDWQIANIRTWIADGAQEDDFYRANVFQIFGNLDDRHGLECARSGSDDGCIVCVTCHYPGSPDPPDLSQPFDPVHGVVGVDASFRSDLKRVDPGNPDASFLLMKLEAMSPSSDVGAPMPYGYPELAAEEIELIRQWIVEGARNN